MRVGITKRDAVRVRRIARPLLYRALAGALVSAGWAALTWSVLLPLKLTRAAVVTWGEAAAVAFAPLAACGVVGVWAGVMFLAIGPMVAASALWRAGGTGAVVPWAGFVAKLLLGVLGAAGVLGIVFAYGAEVVQWASARSAATATPDEMQLQTASSLVTDGLWRMLKPLGLLWLGGFAVSVGARTLLRAGR